MQPKPVIQKISERCTGKGVAQDVKTEVRYEAVEITELGHCRSQGTGGWEAEHIESH